MTNANHRYYKANKQVAKIKMQKYRDILSFLHIYDDSGGGSLMEVNTNKIDDVHWDDPNELADRLYLPLATPASRKYFFD